MKRLLPLLATTAGCAFLTGGPGCGSQTSSVETVPPELLGGGGDSAKSRQKEEPRAPISSTSTGREQLPYFPPPADAQVTESGLQLVHLARGSGKRRPYQSSQVTVHYEGRTQDGEVFDSSVARGQPATFKLGDVIEGWREAVALMVEGDRIRAWIPEELAYRGAEGAPAGLLIFDIELISIEDEDSPTSTQPD